MLDWKLRKGAIDGQKVFLNSNVLPLNKHRDVDMHLKVKRSSSHLKQMSQNEYM